MTISISTISTGDVDLFRDFEFRTRNTVPVGWLMKRGRRISSLYCMCCLTGFNCLTYRCCLAQHLAHQVFSNSTKTFDENVSNSFFVSDKLKVSKTLNGESIKPFDDKAFNDSIKYSFFFGEKKDEAPNSFNGNCL